MKVLLVLFLTIASACAFSVEPREYRDIEPVIPGFNPDARITNGKPGAIANFPYQVGLKVDGGWCGGSLISNTWVLTAAHCVDGIPTCYITAYMGSAIRERGTSRVAKYKIIHSGFNSTTLLNDIAVLKIDPVSYNRNIKKAILPPIGSYSNYSGNTVIASGWGRTTDLNWDNANSLQYAELKVIPNSVCFNAFGSMTTASNICIATPGGTSPCNGDSGGPLVLKSNKVQIGFASFASKLSCTSGYPVAFIRISSYRQWIKDNTGV